MSYSVQEVNINTIFELDVDKNNNIKNGDHSKILLAFQHQELIILGKGLETQSQFKSNIRALHNS